MKLDDKPLLSVNDVREVVKEFRKKTERSLSTTAARYIARKNLESEIKHRLENSIPTGGKYRVLRKMARLFDKEKVVSNYQLVQCFKATTRGNNRRLRKFSKKDYYDGKIKYDERLTNRFKQLKRFWRGLDYAITFSKHQSRIVFTRNVAGSHKNKHDITPKSA